MANNQEDLKIKLTADTSEFKNAMKDVGTSMSNLKSQFVLAQSALGNFGTNTDGLKNKAKFLSDTITEQQKRVELLKKAYEDSASKLGENDAKTQNLSTRYNYAQAQLNKFRTELEATNSSIRIQSNRFTTIGTLLSGIGNKFSAVGSKLSGIGKSLTSSITMPAIGVISLAVQGASDLNETLGKTEVVFGDSAKSVETWGDSTIKNYGLAKGTALDMASGFGDMATAMGFTQEESAKMGEQLVARAADLSSFKNISTDVAKTALNGIFTGEGESLKGLGVIMNQTTLQQYAYEKGIKKKLSAISQAELVQLRYNYVMENSSKAEGDFARTSSGTANSIRIFHETVKELQANLAEKLLPIITPIVQKITELTQKFSELSPSTQNIALGFGAFLIAIGPIMSAFGGISSLIGVVVSAFGALATAIGSCEAVMAILTGPIGIIVGAIAGITAVIVTLWNTNEGFRNAVIGIWNNVSSFFQTTWNNISAFFQTTWNNIAIFFQTLWNNISVAFQTTWNNIVVALTPIWEGFKNAFNSVVNVMLDIWKGIVIVFSVVWYSVSDVLTSTWNMFKDMFNSTVEQLKVIWNNIKEPILAVWNSVTGLISDVWNQVVSSVSSVWDGFMTAFNSVCEALKQAWGAVAGLVSDVWNQVVSSVSSVWNSFSGTFNQICGAVSGAWNSFTGGITNTWNSIVGQIIGAWNSIKGPFKSVADWIGGIWNGIKAYFKLPHFSIEGSLNPLDWVKGGVPHVKVDWYADGAIFTRPTVLNGRGFGDRNNGRGNNAEAVLPLNALWNELERRFQSQTEALINMNRVININNAVHLDGKEVGRGVARYVEEENGYRKF